MYAKLESLRFISLMLPCPLAFDAVARIAVPLFVR
jgi:hypothetical protein